MDFIEQVDPELRVVLEKLPKVGLLDLNKIVAARAVMKKMFLSSSGCMTAGRVSLQRVLQPMGSGRISFA